MKGKLEEAISKARFTEGDFYVQYRDFNKLIHLPISEFWKIAEIVPEHRIARVIKELSCEGRHSIDGIHPIYESSDHKLLNLKVVFKEKADADTLEFVKEHMLKPTD